MEIKDAKQLNLLSLAFLGDAAFTLYIRNGLVAINDGKSGALHALASKYVCASAQAKMLDGITPLLVPDELDIARRSRNAHNNSKAKNASLADYKKATALEGVIGYLWISGQTERANYIMAQCKKIMDEELNSL